MKRYLNVKSLVKRSNTELSLFGVYDNKNTNVLLVINIVNIDQKRNIDTVVAKFSLNDVKEFIEGNNTIVSDNAVLKVVKNRLDVIFLDKEAYNFSGQYPSTVRYTLEAEEDVNFSIDVLEEITNPVLPPDEDVSPYSTEPLETISIRKILAERETEFRKYEELSTSDKLKRANIWTRLLDDFCHKDPETGNRPCDFGVPCDRCRYDYGINRNFALICKQDGLSIEDDRKYLEEIE